MAFDILNVRYQVNIEEITESLNAMDQIPRTILNEIAAEIELSAKNALIAIFEEAADQQSEDAFPHEFRGHLTDVVANSKFESHVQGAVMDISYDFHQLGTREELKRAFHQGALLADGKTRLDGPYTGQALKNEDPDRRHIFWGSVQKGLASAPNPVGPGHIPIEPGAWDNTKNKYIEIWGNKAPNWLYLQFGQDLWEPEISSSPIMETFETTLNELGSTIFYEKVAYAIEAAQKRGTTLTPFGARLTDTTDEVGPSGRPRKRGQFYPLR